MISPTNSNFIDPYNNQSTMKPANYNLNNMNYPTSTNNYNLGMKPQLNPFSISPASGGPYAVAQNF